MKFIVFEGLDGAGKSTLMHNVERLLGGQSHTTVFVRDPGTTAVGEKLRKIILDPSEKPSPKTEILMYQAARSQLVDEIIAPQLKQGHWVLSDRFYSSTIAFQCHARGIDRASTDWLNHYACGEIQPDLVVFVDIPVEESQKRLNKRSAASGETKDRMEQEDLAFHQKVRQGYLLQAKEEPAKWLVLDGFRTPEQLLEDVRAYFRKQQWLG